MQAQQHCLLLGNVKCCVREEMLSHKLLSRLLYNAYPFNRFPNELLWKVLAYASNLSYITFINACGFATTYRTCASRREVVIPPHSLRVLYCDRRVLLCCGTLRTLRPWQTTVVFLYGKRCPGWVYMMKDRGSCMIV